MQNIAPYNIMNLELDGQGNRLWDVGPDFGAWDQGPYCWTWDQIVGRGTRLLDLGPDYWTSWDQIVPVRQFFSHLYNKRWNSTIVVTSQLIVIEMTSQFVAIQVSLFWCADFLACQIELTDVYYSMTSDYSEAIKWNYTSGALNSHYLEYDLT